MPEIRATEVLYRAAPGVLVRVLVTLALIGHALTMGAALLLALLVPERPHVLLALVIVLGWGLTGSPSPSFCARPARAAIDGHRRWLRGARPPGR